MNNIVLVGFMAVGKTTIGKSLKEILGYALFDIDKTVEKEEGCSIASIFEEKGESYFRSRERDVARMILARNNNIVSTGGGLFMDEEIRTLALKDNFVVFLDLNLREVYRRIRRNDLRPMAKSKSLKELRELYEKRLPYYRKADIRIRTDHKSPNQVAEEIKTAYFKWLNKEL